jgi:hypothetical protein
MSDSFYPNDLEVSFLSTNSELNISDNNTNDDPDNI